MKLPIPFTRVQLSYPDLIPEIEAQRSRSSSVSKDVPLEDCEWSLNWAVTSEGYETHHDYEGKLKNQLDRLRSISLKCKAGRGMWSIPIPEKYGIPEEIKQAYMASVRANIDEINRIYAMTDEERDAEAEKLIEQLRGTPGFAEFISPVKPKH